MLISALIATAIVMTMLAALVPTLIRKAQIDNADAAAQTLNAIGSADFLYASKYGAFVTPAQLVGNLAATALQPCQNPFGFLMGSQSSAPRGYVMTFTPGATVPSSSFNCSGVVGYSSFQITMDPTDKLEASRRFLYSSSDTSIHFTDEARDATLSDPKYTLSADLVGGSNGNSTAPSNGTGYLGTWNQGQSYAIGSYVLLSPACIGSYAPGSADGGCSSGGVGMFVNISGKNNGMTGANEAWAGFPAGDSTDWQAVGGAVSFVPMGNPNPGITGTLGGAGNPLPVPNATSGTGGNPQNAFNTTNTVTGSSQNFTQLSVVLQTVVPAGGNGINVEVWSPRNGGQDVYCFIPAGGTSCTFSIGTSPTSGAQAFTYSGMGGFTENPFVVFPGDALQFVVNNFTGGSLTQIASATWTLQ